jgi:TRAP-type C4-dicarboxylate transport system permease large subunit
MTMYTHAGLVLAAIVLAFLAARKFRLSTELSMMVATLVGAVAHALIPMGVDPRSPISIFPVRHLVEGMFTYFDVCLIFMTATFFMALLKEAGGVAFIVREIVTRFSRRRGLCLTFLTVLMLVPGAITGSGATTVLTVGGLVGAVFAAMGISETRRVALIYVLACMSAAAPPINLWAMMAAAGANMPYVGFAKPLLVLSLAGAFFATFYLARKSGVVDTEKALAELPQVPPGWNWFRVLLPFAVLVAIVLAGRFVPHAFPVVGLPLIFMISAAVTLAVSPTRLPIFDIAGKTVKDLLPLVGIMVVVGALIQVMALSGARGLISLGVVILPLSVLFGALWLILPLSEGMLQYAVAPLLGVPLIMLFNMKGLNPVICLAAMGVLWPLGDCLPPTAVVGRATVMELHYQGKYYGEFVRTALVPLLFVAVLCTLFLVYSKELSFLGV